MEKTPLKANLLVELTNRKTEAQKSGVTAKPFQKFQHKRPRNTNGSSVGPSWGRRKGN